MELLTAVGATLAALAALLVLAVVALLLLPVRLRISAASEPVRRLRLELGLFGGLLPRLTAYDSTRPGRGAAAREAGDAAVPDHEVDRQERAGRAGRPGRSRRRDRRARQRGPWGRRLRRFLMRRVRPMLRAAPPLVAELLARVHIERLQVHGRFGLGDPADTGFAWGLLAPWLYGIGGMGGKAGARTQVELQPDFQHAGVHGLAEARLRLVPAALLPPVLRFGWRVLRGAAP